jgi:quinol monooxygenase YgiN
VDTHGKNATKYGVVAYGDKRRNILGSDHAHSTSGDFEKMLTLGLLARLEAKPGKEEDVAAFLKQGLQLANQETTTPLWFALRLGPTTFGIFDAFRDDTGRQNHLAGPIARALMEQAPHLLATSPVIEPVEVLGVKLPE